MRAASSIPLVIPFIVDTTEVVDLFATDLPVSTSRKRHRDDDDDLENIRLDIVRMESEQFEAAARVSFMDKMD